jgi:integrase
VRLQREAGLAIVDGVGCLRTTDKRGGPIFRVKTGRQKTGTPVNNPVTEELGRLLLKFKNGNPKHFSRRATLFPRMRPRSSRNYRKAFKKTGVEHTSHDLRPTYAATFSESGGEIRLLRKALGLSSITVKERYYADFTTKQQDMLDKAAEKTSAAMGD